MNRMQRDWVLRHAYVPEQLPDYVTSVSGASPRLFGPYICYIRRKHLSFIGYPLAETGRGLPELSVIESACRQFAAETVTVTAPSEHLADVRMPVFESDHYYRLALPAATIDARVNYMVRRASRDLQVSTGQFNRNHEKLINDFISSRVPAHSHCSIFRKIPQYLSASKSACLIEAWKGNDLSAFSIVDLSARQYAFYMFNFRSTRHSVPGASDLIFREMIRMATDAGKEWINLGLSFHPGVRRFKEKWGGRPFLGYASAQIDCKPKNITTLLTKL